MWLVVTNRSKCGTISFVDLRTMCLLLLLLLKVPFLCQLITSNQCDTMSAFWQKFLNVVVTKIVRAGSGPNRTVDGTVWCITLDAISRYHISIWNVLLRFVKFSFCTKAQLDDMNAKSFTAHFNASENAYMTWACAHACVCNMHVIEYNIHITATFTIPSSMIGKAHKLHFFHSVQIFYWDPLKNCSDHINIIIDVEFPFALRWCKLCVCIQAQQLNTHGSKCENSSRSSGKNSIHRLECVCCVWWWNRIEFLFNEIRTAMAAAKGKTIMTTIQRPLIHSHKYLWGSSNGSIYYLLFVYHINSHACMPAFVRMCVCVCVCACVYYWAHRYACVHKTNIVRYYTFGK